MGLFQSAIETYDAMESYVGVERESKETLAPVCHIIAKAQIIVTISAEGNFISAEAADKKIPVPATEKSSGRTSSPCAHPLVDNLEYIGGADSEKFELYTEQLRQWAEFSGNQKLFAVLSYCEKKTIIKDLVDSGVLKAEDDGSVKGKPMIAWVVDGLGEKSGPVWNDREIQNSFADFNFKTSENEKTGFCQITGDEGNLIENHLGGVNYNYGKAKIISANDNVNFTYRGRFTDSNQALTIGYIASQKAHNALKWLVANQRVFFGDTAYVCWNPKGYSLPLPSSPFSPKGEEKCEPTEYKKAIYDILNGYSEAIPEDEKAIIASFDAATTGRLSVSYYNELLCSDFLSRLAWWDETCCWYDNRFGTSSPPLKRIIDCAYGMQHSGDENAKLETDEKILKAQMKRLVACRVEKSKIPRDIVKAIVTKAGNLQIYNKKNKSSLLFTACALIRKYRIDYYKEECEMALESEKKDRSYQYGRLLAVLEKMEADTYQKGEERETNAIRMQNVFVQRPAYAAKIITEKLTSGYKSRLSSGSRVFYERLIGEIMAVISEFEEDYNKPLSEMYLLGYYLQRNEFYKKSEKVESTEVNENE